MPRNRTLFAVAVSLVLIAAIAGLAWAILKTNQLDNAARELALTVVQEAFQSEYPIRLIENSHPDYRASFPEAELLRFLESTKLRLGSLNAVIAIRGSAEIPKIPSQQKISSAEYEVDLDFQHSPATVVVQKIG